MLEQFCIEWWETPTEYFFHFLRNMIIKVHLTPDFFFRSNKFAYYVE